MLGQLELIHDDLREAIAELAAVVRNPSLDEAALSASRLKLVKLSSTRHALLVCTIFPKLNDVSAVEAARIADLALENIQIRSCSSDHIGRWTMNAIRADWPGYQRASAEMRVSMLKRIDREAMILYPILKAKAARIAA